MASALISQLYEAINALGTDIVGADSGEFPCCLLAFELDAEDWYGANEEFLLQITVPSNSRAIYYGESCFCSCSFDGEFINLFKTECDILYSETAPNQYSSILTFVVDPLLLADYASCGTIIIVICADVQFFPQAQQGKVETDPSKIQSDMGLTTSLDNPYAPTPTPLSTPTGLYADNITSDSATTHWTGDANASNYKVQYKAAGDTVWTETYTD